MTIVGLLAAAAPVEEKTGGGFSLDPAAIWATVQQLVAVHALKVLAGLVILVIGWLLAKLVRAVTEKILRRGKVDPTVVSFVKHLTYYSLLAFVFLAALNQVGVQTTSMIAVLGAAGLAVGLALQGALSNFAAGLLLIIFRPFRVGDFVAGGGVEGAVTEVGILTSTLNSPDNRKLVVPNAKMLGDSIVNYTANGTRRVDLVVGVSYGADLARARKVILEVISSDGRVLKSPEPTVGVLELAESSVNLAVRPWAAAADYWNVHFGMLEAIKNRLDAEGISIPFPQRDVHLYQKTPG